MSNTLTIPYGYSAWYNLVKPTGKWDHKYAIHNKLIRSTQTLFSGTRGNWFAHIPPSDGKSCPAPDSWYSYDVWSNIHYGFIGLRAGFSEGILLAGGDFAQAGWTDTAEDKAAIKLGFHLFNTYGNSFTLAQFRQQIIGWNGLDKTGQMPK